MSLLEQQQRALDALAKEMRPTRNGSVTAKHFMVAAETLFKQRGWNMSAYIEWANGNYAIRQVSKQG